jgi:hypothetical protein
MKLKKRKPVVPKGGLIREVEHAAHMVHEHPCQCL